MKSIRFLILSTVIFVFSCARNHQEPFMMMDAEASPDAGKPAAASGYATADFVSSSAAREHAADTSRRFIRTAELHFKTKDVIRATYAIEEIIARHGGFVENTELRTVVNRVESIRVSRDSILESTFYTIHNTMKLRVPFRRLDASLKDIAVWAEFMDYRKVNAVDVRLSLLANDLTRRRAARQEKRLENAIDEKGEKLNHVVDAEDRLAARQEQADNALLSNMELKDRIDFSTVEVQIRQEHACKRTMKASDENIGEYRPGFGSRMADALVTGWRGLVEFTVFMARFWALWLIVAGIYAGIRLWRKKGKN